MYPLRRAAFLLIAALTLPTGLSGQRVSGEKLVFIVRHAEKANATEQDPSLSEIGRARAVALAAALRDAGVSDVLVTQRKRTHETAAAVTEARQLIAHVVPFGASTPDHAAAVAAAVRKTKGDAVLVVGHSNTVTLIVAALGGPRLPELCDAEYSNLFIVRLPARGSPTFVRAHFGAPDPANAATCAAASMR
ncbi:MAG: histidine phosphatase family protein [Gemmatimonadaceae bacterium]|nr:histidine phosphatase family protein [Gemmatimonadaceae bacterium]